MKLRMRITAASVLLGSMNTSKSLNVHTGLASITLGARAARRMASWSLMITLLLPVVSERPAASGVVGYSNFGQFFNATQYIPGVHLDLPFDGQNRVLWPGFSGYNVTISNVTFIGNLEVGFVDSSRVIFLLNYDEGLFLRFHCPGGIRAFGGFFSSWSSAWQSNFTGTIATDQGDSFSFPALVDPQVTFYGMISTNSFYNAAYSDGGPLHEELVSEVFLVVNPAPVLDISFGIQGQVNIAVNGSPGQAVTLQASTNLVTWQDLTGTTLASERWVYTDTQTNRTTPRYYRTLLH